MYAPLLLLLIVAGLRVALGIAGSADMQWLHNFSPVAAIALCGAVYLPRRTAIVLPLMILVLSDLALNAFYHVSMLSADILPRYVALGLIAFLGFCLRGRVNFASLLAASFVGSVLFYLVSNTGSWLYDPAYAKTGAGWLQALTVGDGRTGHPSTWWFYRHTLAGDLVFTALFFVCASMGNWRAERSATAVAAV